MSLMSFTRMGPRELSLAVQNVLVYRFHLDPQYLKRLRMLEKPGSFAGKPVRRLRIFDPSILAGETTSAMQYEELSSSEKRGALLFEGHIGHSGFVYLADRRLPNPHLDASKHWQ